MIVAILTAWVAYQTLRFCIRLTVWCAIRLPYLVMTALVWGFRLALSIMFFRIPVYIPSWVWKDSRDGHSET